MASPPDPDPDPNPDPDPDPDPDERYRQPRLEHRMSDLLAILLVIGAWLALQYFVLPRLGVPT